MTAAQPAETSQAAAEATGSIAAMRGVVEPIAIALITSTGLYLVGSVYTDAYYGRMSIETTSLDLSPTFVGLQSLHVLQSLLGYPSTLLVYYLVYRFLRPRLGWLRRLQPRLGRAGQWLAPVVILLANLLLVLPLLSNAGRAVFGRPIPSASTVGDITILLTNVAALLLVYVIWLSLGQRRFIAGEIRQRKTVPLVLVGLAYLLGALVSTADTGSGTAEAFMLGITDSSFAITFTLRDDVAVIDAETELLLVAARNGNYFVVERQTFPPDPRPISHIIPYGSVEAAAVQRVNPAGMDLVDYLDPSLLVPASPVAP